MESAWTENGFSGIAAGEMGFEKLNWLLAVIGHYFCQEIFSDFLFIVKRVYLNRRERRREN
jgi:hypothetical protein